MLYFRLPFGDKIFTIDDINGNDKVDFLSFDLTEKISFQGNLKSVRTQDLVDSPVFSTVIHSEIPNIKIDSEQEYLDKVNQVISFVKEENLQKLVFSRRKAIGYQQLNLSATFLKLAERYPNAFVYFFIRNEKCWMGAFSELLGEFQKSGSEFKTMSLAGTLPVQEPWSSKEIEEQKPVTEFIENTLSAFGTNLTKSATYDHISGNIKHLRTDFKMKIESENLEKIIEALHPTPAVCGIPKEICTDAIQRFESSPRSLYAGYIRVETPNEIKYFVNLRCAQFFSDGAIIFVGGGITADSSADKEWRETELKAGAITESLVF